MVDVTKAYYQGLIDGLEEGISSLKHILENAKTLDDVLVEYNALVVDCYETYQKLGELKELSDDNVFLIPTELAEILLQKGDK